MGQYGLALVLVRGAGLLIAVLALTSAPYEAARVLRARGGETLRVSWTNAELVEFWAATIGPPLVSIAIGLAIFWCAGLIVERSLAPKSTETGRAGMDSAMLEKAAVVAIGFYLLADGCSYAVRDIAAIVTVKFMEFDYGIIPDSMKFDIVGDALRAAVGLALVLLAHRLVDLRRRLVAPRSD